TMDLSPEKKAIIDTAGNILVTANPGTGKTYLLAAKYVELLKSGLKPCDILCLTFTKKACREMEERILKFIEEEKLTVDFAELNIHTFHSFSLDNIENNDIISSNVIRYAVFQYITQNELLNYSEEYILETIVPSIENAISYLKNFEILPEDIDVEKVKPLINETKSMSAEDLHAFLDMFIAIYKIYESSKTGGKIDYADILLEFSRKITAPLYEYVLIDELQDVNKIEAQIALKSGKTFFAVGDKKQAIFGFQGGSIENFSLFEDSSHFVLNENRRSTQNVLDYARMMYVKNTNDAEQVKELEGLHNESGVRGNKVGVIEAEKKEFPQKIFSLISAIPEDKKIGIITRTNAQAAKLSKVLKDAGIEHSTTSAEASMNAKAHGLAFIKGIISHSIDDIKSSMLTPFFPASMRDVFQVTKDRNVTCEDIYAKFPAYKEIRESVQKVTDLEILFAKYMLPVAAQNGKEYFLGIVNLQQVLIDAINDVASESLDDIFGYIRAADQVIEDTSPEKRISITTVHKSKGLEYHYAVYIPSKKRNKDDFVKIITRAIVLSKGTDASVELEEENLRIDFVAYTRARDQLYILTEDASLYVNDVSEIHSVSEEKFVYESQDEKYRKAFSLFVAGDMDTARALLHDDEKWLLSYVTNYFDSVDSISFSALKSDAYEYLKSSILRLKSLSKALELGTQIHSWAEDLLKGKEIAIDEPIFRNIVTLHEQLLSEGYTPYSAEESVQVSIKDVFGVNTSLLFKGKIDAIYHKEDSYLIVDWKSSKDETSASTYRQQLAVYKKMFAHKKNIPEEKISVAIGFVALREKINDGTIKCNLDRKQPAKSAFETVLKRVELLFAWKSNPSLFLEAVFSKESDEYLWKALEEEVDVPKDTTRVPQP
ncbi:MAG: UvrD-helicase domain-containing protein, partial [Candidatus Woesearchaeota archaeon]